MHNEKEWIDKAAQIIKDLTREAEKGKFYTGKVVRIEKFGAFVELWKGCEGLLHISKISREKIDKVEDVLRIGDEITVCVIGIDEKGRVDLSTKEGMEKANNSETASKDKEDKNSSRKFKPRDKRQFKKKEE